MKTDIDIDIHIDIEQAAARRTPPGDAAVRRTQSTSDVGVAPLHGAGGAQELVADRGRGARPSRSAGWCDR